MNPDIKRSKEYRGSSQRPCRYTFKFQTTLAGYLNPETKPALSSPTIIELPLFPYHHDRDY